MNVLMRLAWYRTVQPVLLEGRRSVTHAKLAIFHRMSRPAWIVTQVQLNSFVKNAKTKNIATHVQLDTEMSLVHARSVTWKHVQNVMRSLVIVKSAKKNSIWKVMDHALRALPLAKHV